MASLSLKRPIIFFDLETTGTNIVTDRIVEISLVKILPDGSRDSWLQRLNPGIPIPAEATAVHGISDEDVRDEKSFRQIGRDLWTWMKGCDLGGYNFIRFDLPLLVEEFMRAGVTEADFRSCKLVDAQRIFFKMQPRDLSAAYQFYCGKTLEDAHSAEADNKATIEVLEAQIEAYDLGNDVADLHDFIAEPAPFVDYAGKLRLNDKKEAVFAFGKYTGRRVEEVFTQEPSYYDWMMKADFSLDTKQKISDIYNRMKLEKLRSK